MAPSSPKSSSIKPMLVAAIGLAAATAFALVVPILLVGSYPDLTWRQYRADLLSASLTVATGILLSVVVAMLIENHRQRSARRSADRELRRALIAQLRDVHDQVKAAALLIKAHQSARTYGEQMRRLIEVRVRLLDARRTLGAERGAFGAVREALLADVGTAASYLEELAGEYEREYLRVSRIQLYSYEWDLAQARKAAQQDRPPDPQQMKASTVPWCELTGPAFGRLTMLLEADREARQVHEEEFSKPLGRVIDTLRRQNNERL